MQVAEHGLQREAMFLAKRDDQAVIGGCCLQLEIERDTEALAQGQSPGLIDSSAKGRMDDELHAATLVEKALGDDGLLRRHSSQDRSPTQYILDGLLGTSLVEAALLLEKVEW